MMKQKQYFVVNLKSGFGRISTETDNMKAKECDRWIRENNKRMKAICKLLNDNNL